jgi:hypothetical protein
MNYEVRTLKLTIDDQSQLVRHYLWPDAQITKTGNRVALLELMKASRAAAGDSPRVVCCTTSVGLANTWVALDFLREELEAGSFIRSSPQEETLSEGAADISNPNNDDLIWTTVGRMHGQGTTMEMNESEYKFLYETLRDEISKLYAEPGEDPLAIAETSGAESRAHDTHERSFTCASSGCPYGLIGFVAEKDLQRHMFDHHGIKADDDQVEFPDAERGGGMRQPSSFQCNLCPKRFTRAHNLRSHLRTHSDERPFVCTVCGKGFARQHDRKRHEAIHSGKREPMNFPDPVT